MTVVTLLIAEMPALMKRPEPLYTVALAQRGTLNMRNVIEMSAVYNDFFIAGPAGLQ